MIEELSSRRALPSMVTAWRADDRKKRVFATKREAYYDIAKRLVVAKYPAWLCEDREEDAPSILRVFEDDEDASKSRRPLSRRAWPPSVVLRRRSKLMALFFERDDEGDYICFDSVRWTKFVRRVARFLEYVDERRGLEFAAPTASLQEMYEYAEGQAVRWMSHADRLREQIVRRSNL